ncbi:Nad dependent epimerase dehydratase family protein [Colletotrichum higginsianum IMI 349063]|uniref:Nad dependent epimerase dehydratase family protein n=3 Tax=Colletotrichum higginsianum TaxID=80884 RepID=A0A1B7YB39_COLHI|nr:Nad dependent epimerase dehydratase family protein [Colletotrichum higginsianum IMI 349063]OBR09282.1 Nad dependent epimerase dehydratase family protein [Colletotrichum higginsianum IMI 349063]TIC95927.1 Protein fmp-52, mitochondrial [Colletotrichum higginsianum]GJC96658.1 NAD dependent epimerase dehydratase family protein [Colletotrichum higginsianum]
MAHSAAVIGSTGLVGSHILTNLITSEAFAAVNTISRRPPKAGGLTLKPIIEQDTSAWPPKLAALQPLPTVVFSALGTTRAAAGSIAEQWKIDHDLNIELVKAAKTAGCKAFIFISSAGTRGALSAQAPYSKMKNGVEDAIKEAGFDHGIILKPGMILGQREESRAAEGIFQSVIRTLGMVSRNIQDSIGQEAEVIARAAVHAAVLVEQGKAPAGVWEISGAEIVRLGRTEWKHGPWPRS